MGEDAYVAVAFEPTTPTTLNALVNVFNGQVAWGYVPWPIFLLRAAFSQQLSLFSVILLVLALLVYKSPCQAPRHHVRL